MLILDVKLNASFEDVLHRFSPFLDEQTSRNVPKLVCIKSEKTCVVLKM